MIDTKALQSPCKTCKTDPPACRKTCGKLREFVLVLDHTDYLLGAVDTGGEYKLTPK